MPHLFDYVDEDEITAARLMVSVDESGSVVAWAEDEPEIKGTGTTVYDAQRDLCVKRDAEIVRYQTGPGWFDQVQVLEVQ